MTGTREGCSDVQLEWLRLQIETWADCLHHGGCVGADKEAHYCAVNYGIHTFIHTPADKRLMMYLPSDGGLVTILPPKPYLEGNRDIVDASERLIAVPKNTSSDKGETGGTWYTVHYAVKQGHPVSICYRDGVVEER